VRIVFLDPFYWVPRTTLLDVYPRTHQRIHGKHRYDAGSSDRRSKFLFVGPERLRRKALEGGQANLCDPAVRIIPQGGGSFHAALRYVPRED